VLDKTLLDSSPSRRPVLSRSHWALSLAAGALGCFVSSFGLGRLLAAPNARVLAGWSILAGMLVTSWALMLCYVYADSKRLSLNARLWAALTLVFSLAGFVAYLVFASAKTGEWQRAAVPVAYALDAVLLGALALLPLFRLDALPKLLNESVIPPPLPPGAPGPANAPAKRGRRASPIDLMNVRVVIPQHIPAINDPFEPPVEESTGVAEDPGRGIPGPSIGILGGIGTEGTPPPPMPATRGGKIRRVKVGGIVEAAKLIFAPKPGYPPVAIIARIQGTVRLAAVISQEGTVQELRALSGSPFLVKSAIEAVSRWRYQPTLLDGEPVEVVTEIEVKFILAE
jgi:periplasmic protein TonB